MTYPLAPRLVRPLRRRFCCGLVLCSYVLTIFGYPLPAPAEGEGGKPSTSANLACGCAAATGCGGGNCCCSTHQGPSTCTSSPEPAQNSQVIEQPKRSCCQGAVDCRSRVHGIAKAGATCAFFTGGKSSLDAGCGGTCVSGLVNPLADLRRQRCRPLLWSFGNPSSSPAVGFASRPRTARGWKPSPPIRLLELFEFAHIGIFRQHASPGGAWLRGAVVLPF